MKKEKEYVEHISRRWSFSKEMAEIFADAESRKDLTLAIFDKTCIPYHYFIQNDGQEMAGQSPTERQISYAKQLGILEPEKLSREELSKKIDEALKSKRKNGEGA